jgi:hypothetical protein
MYVVIAATPGRFGLPRSCLLDASANINNIVMSGQSGTVHKREREWAELPKGTAEGRKSRKQSKWTKRSEGELIRE